MKIIVGLGNPGKAYENTRHNAGFMALDRFAKRHDLSFSLSKFNGMIAQGFVQQEKVILLKPMTFMNLSGESLIQVINFYKAEIEDVVVVMDDLDLPVGRLRVRPTGSDGGQRGMRNIIQHLHTKDIARIRIGIGNNKIMETKDYVLGKIPADERVLFDQSLDQAVNAMEYALKHPILEVMNRYNTHGEVK